jgi:Tfp pilus assembly protein PilO
MEKMRQWSILTGVAVVAVFALGWFLLVSPQRSHAASLRSQAASQQSANATLQAQVSQLEQQKKDLPAQQRVLAQIATKIPSNPELPALIRQLSAAAQGAGVDLVSMAPSPPALVTSVASTSAATLTGTTASGTTPAAHAKASPLAQIPLSIQVQGSYFNLESFFAAAEKLSRAMLVTQFSMTPAGGAGSGSAPASGSSTGASTGAQHALPPGTLSATLSAVVFESPEVATSTHVSPIAPVAPAK